jgi:outer membrane protein TolC
MYTKHFFKGAYRGTQLSLLLGLSISIAQAESLSLDQALARAESKNPSLEAFRESRLSATERVGASDALPNPKLQVSYFGESVETRTGSQEAIYSFSQTVPWLSKLSTRKDIAQSDASVSGFAYEHALARLRREVAITYVELLYLENSVETTEQNLGLIQDMRSIVEEQVSGGASINSMLRLELEYERKRDDLDKLEQERIEQRHRLAALLAMPEAELSLVGELEAVDSSVVNASSLHQVLVENNPELLALRQSSIRASQQAELSRLARRPDFTVGLNYIQVDGSGIAARDAGNDPWNVSLAVSLPIWAGKDRANIRAANANRRSVDSSYLNRELALKAELSATLASFQDSARRMQRYEETLIPLADQALDNSRAAYESDQLSALEMIDSERSLLELKLNYWRAAANARQAVAKINALIGE